MFQLPWGFRTHLTPLVLNRLTPPKLRHGRGDAGEAAPARAVREQIVAQTDGIPRFVEEVTKAVVEAGHLTDVPDQDAATRPVPPGAIPATLHEAFWPGSIGWGAPKAWHN